MSVAYKTIQIVSREFLDALFDCEGSKYRPIGKFLCRDVVNGKTVWVAVDNSSGEAFTEEFAYRRNAAKYLHGYPVENIQGDPLNVSGRWS